jgi:hypothetical protein
MNGQNRQGWLFPFANGDWRPPTRQTIAPGDWHSIECEGKTVVGMIYRCADERYRFVYWDRGVLRFGTTLRDQIGPRDEELTSQFRGQVAVIPHYVEWRIAEWIMQPKERFAARSVAASQDPAKGELAETQKWLFPE